MKQGSATIRDTDAGESLEILLITAVLTILSIRVYLHLANYPTVGGDKLHIAHMLWGGLSMLVALVMLLTYWNPAVRRIAAVLAGIGWGTFIDELGKFITNDNDYFFQPTFALLYILFMLMFIIFRSLTRESSYTPHELSINQDLRTYLQTAENARGVIGWLGRLVLGSRARIDTFYDGLVAQDWFNFLLVAVFLVVGTVDLIKTGWYLFGNAPERTLDPEISRYEILATALSNLCIWIGIFWLRRSRLDAMRWFKRSLLVIMFLATPFHFYHDQLWAFIGFLVTLAVYLMLRYAIEREEYRADRAQLDEAWEPV